jgi:hypothetical protein
LKDSVFDLGVLAALGVIALAILYVRHFHGTIPSTAADEVLNRYAFLSCQGNAGMSRLVSVATRAPQ